MKKQKINLPALCLCLLAFSFLLTTGMQCKKTSDTTKEEVLPAETQTGKQTFGCLVNGEVWLPKTSYVSSPLTASIQFNILSIGVRRDNENIVFGIRNLSDKGVYPFKGDNSVQYAVSGNRFVSYEGEINIKKYDKQLNIISGTFYFIAKNELGDIVEVKDGRFDLNYTN